MEHDTALVVIAVASVLNGAMALVGVVIAGKTKMVAERTEVNTNSMREQLVRATAESSHAAGMNQARAEGEAKAATLAEGQLRGKSDK